MPDNKCEWLFDESVHSGVDYAKDDIVGDYDNRHETFRNYDEEAGKIAVVLGLDKNSVVLDIGCGTGGISIALAKNCKHIYAVDVSEAMITSIHQKISQSEVNNITVRQGGFLTYEHKGEKPDAIIVNITLHHLPDFWKQIALCRFYDILKSEGKLFIGDVVFKFEPRKYKEEINRWLNDMKTMADDKMSKESAIHIKEEYSTWDWIMTGMLERAGFTIESNTEFMPNMRAYVCRKSL